MQKRHFEAIAATLRDLKPDRGNSYASRTVKTKGEAAYVQWLATVNAFASMLGNTNPRFDVARFRTACAYTGGRIAWRATGFSRERGGGAIPLGRAGANLEQGGARR